MRCARELRTHGLRDADVEQLFEGCYCRQRWDVGAALASAVPVLVSAKCFSTGRAKNAGHRLAEMLASALDVRGVAPNAALGFLALVLEDTEPRPGLRSLSWTTERIGREVGLRCTWDREHPQHFDVGCVLAASLTTGRIRSLRAPGLVGFNRFASTLGTLREARATLEGR